MDFWGLFGRSVRMRFDLSVRKMRLVLIMAAAAITAVVAFFKPEYAEVVAKAFMLLITGVS